ncbi:MAG: methyltransferase domain-containing protein [Alphaproteobacteria bacterium]|nr:methyltransferase domain-containing protein [Alphaproteobacteria bacterium]
MIPKLKHFLHELQVNFTHIPRRGMVLEIGSGDQPFPRSDVLCDRFVFDNTERVGDLVVDRPLVVGDIYDLPFRGGAFDFVICHHVLEHLDAPEAAAAELSRVAKAGSIRVPSRLSEKLTGSVYHRWFISRDDGGLLFEPKAAPVFDAEIKTFMKTRVLGEGRYAAFYNRFRQEVEIEQLWKGSIPVTIAQDAGGSVDRSQFRAATQAGAPNWNEIATLKIGAGGFKQRARSTFSRFVRAVAGGSSARLDAALACPVCKGPLVRRENAYECEPCSCVYPVAQGVPVLLKEAANAALHENRPAPPVESFRHDDAH